MRNLGVGVNSGEIGKIKLDEIEESHLIPGTTYILSYIHSAISFHINDLEGQVWIRFEKHLRCRKSHWQGGVISHLGRDRGHGCVKRSTNAHVAKRMNIGTRPVFKHALRAVDERRRCALW